MLLLGMGDGRSFVVVGVLSFDQNKGVSDFFVQMKYRKRVRVFVFQTQDHIQGVMD